MFLLLTRTIFYWLFFPFFLLSPSFFFLSSCSSSSLSLSLSFSTPSGLFRNFKRRYFYLKDDRLEYWKTPPGDEDTTELPSDGDTPLHHHRSTSSVISTTNDELKCSKCFFLARTTDIEVRKKKNKKRKRQEKATFFFEIMSFSLRTDFFFFFSWSFLLCACLQLSSNGTTILLTNSLSQSVSFFRNFFSK